MYIYIYVYIYICIYTTASIFVEISNKGKKSKMYIDLNTSICYYFHSGCCLLNVLTVCRSMKPDDETDKHNNDTKGT